MTHLALRSIFPTNPRTVFVTTYGFVFATEAEIGFVALPTSSRSFRRPSTTSRLVASLVGCSVSGETRFGSDQVSQIPTMAAFLYNLVL